jgi:hypothetical protein
MAELFAAAVTIIGGMTYWNRAMGQPADAKPDVDRPSLLNSTDEPSNRPRSAQRSTGQLQRFHRVGGEIKASDKNVANSPYVQSIFKIDPALEYEASKIRAAPDIDEMLNK